ncbi:hypothetical protein SALBM311S_12802 [Streptomyces alboniger]
MTLVVGRVPHADVEAALRDGAGELLEAIRLFDVYENARGDFGEGQEVARVRVRFRAADRTLTVDEASAARDTAVALAGERTGAVLRLPCPSPRLVREAGSLTLPCHAVDRIGPAFGASPVRGAA